MCSIKISYLLYSRVNFMALASTDIIGLENAGLDPVRVMLLLMIYAVISSTSFNVRWQLSRLVSAYVPACLHH